MLSKGALLFYFAGRSKAKHWQPAASFLIHHPLPLLSPQALVGYLREAERTEVPEEFSYTHGRYRCWVSLGVTHFLVPDASLAAHVAGILAGLLHIYTPRACECPESSGRSRGEVGGKRCASEVVAASFERAGLTFNREEEGQQQNTGGALSACRTKRQLEVFAGLIRVPLPPASPRAGLALWRQLTGRQPPMRLQAGMLQRHRGRWWWDALGHALVGGAAIALVLMRRRSLARAGPGQ